MKTTIQPLKDRFSMLWLSPRLALLYRALLRPGKGGRIDRIQCGYFGFDSEEKAKAFVQMLYAKYPGIRAVYREPERLKDCAFEVKVWEFEQLLGLAVHCAHQEQEKTVTVAAA